ncbi:MAG: tetratricopeptide repeat protein [Mobilicoccus sp.]|nr:tetratricopeptide repeat protein [Mobilicoccus sp.]
MTHPVGLFPFPAGLCVVDDTLPGAQEVRDALLAGVLPEPWPESFAWLALAHDGEPARAAAALPSEGSRPIAAYNRYVLAGDLDTAARADADAGLAALWDVVAYSTGERVTPPADDEALPGEVRAMIASALAGHAVQDRDIDRATTLLTGGADAAQEVSPVLAAALRAEAAGLRLEHGGDPREAVAALDAALAVLDPTELTTTRAEVHLHRGSARHELAAAGAVPLQYAVEDYHATLRLVSKDSDPHTWANAQQGLATAHLTMPMSSANDRLRIGVAIQGLRAALEVFTRESAPRQWASTTLNLANALAYAPSAHPAENLAEAVELYSEILEVRSAATEPLGRARVLANLGTCLAHLGRFDDAQTRLEESRRLFSRAGDEASAATVAQAMADMTSHREQA